MRPTWLLRNKDPIRLDSMGMVMEDIKVVGVDRGWISSRLEVMRDREVRGRVDIIRVQAVGM